MVATEPKIDLKARYSTTEASKLLGVSRSTIRNYRDKGILPYNLRKANGRLFYKGEDLIRIWRNSAI